MGRRSIYTTADEKKKARARYHEELKRSEQRYGLKIKSNRERLQKKRAEQYLQRKADRSTNLGDVGPIHSGSSNHSQADEVELRSMARIEQKGAMEAFVPSSENMATESRREFSDGYGSGK
jgi:hypothetical protein